MPGLLGQASLIACWLHSFSPLLLLEVVAAAALSLGCDGGLPAPGLLVGGHLDLLLLGVVVAALSPGFVGGLPAPCLLVDVCHLALLFLFAFPHSIYPH